MEKVQLITANDDLAIKLQRHLGEELIHTDSVDHAVMNVSTGAVGTTIIHGYEKMSVLLRIVTFLRDACPSMAITCLVKPENVSRVMNSELKPYIYRVLPNNISAGQVVLAVNSSQKEHEALQEREALGENLTVQLDRKDFSDQLSAKPVNPLAMRLLLLLMLLGTLLLAWYVYNQQSTVNSILSSANEPQPLPEIQPRQATMTADELMVSENTNANLTPASETVATTSTPTENNDTPKKISSLLLAATNAQLRDQLIEPYADNAITYYQQVITLDPENQAAREGLQQVQQQLVQRINTAIAENKVEIAGTDFLALRSLNPEHPELEDLQQRLLNDAKPAVTANSREIKEEELSQTRLEQLLQIQIDDIATTRLAQIDNAININAFASATNLLSRPRDDLAAYENQFQDRTLQLYAALTTQIKRSIEAESYNQANELLDTLALLGFSADVAAYQEQIASTTVAPPAQADVFIAAKAINIVPPIYPRAAEKRALDGYVVLRYQISINGSAANIEVLDSQPGKIFDQAAIRSIRASSFSPAIRNGVPEAQVVEQRLNFTF